jgi:hypothetical protein
LFAADYWKWTEAMSIPQTTKYTLEIYVGFLWFSPLRRVLQTYAWEDTAFEWRESKGWLDKTFYVKGSKEDIVSLALRFEGWCSKPGIAL